MHFCVQNPNLVQSLKKFGGPYSRTVAAFRNSVPMPSHFNQNIDFLYPKTTWFINRFSINWQFLKGPGKYRGIICDCFERGICNIMFLSDSSNICCCFWGNPGNLFLLLFSPVSARQGPWPGHVFSCTVTGLWTQKSE